MLTDVTAMTTSRAVATKAKSRSLPPVSEPEGLDDRAERAVELVAGGVARARWRRRGRARAAR